MLYGDEELKRWWAGLTRHDQKELLAIMLDKMESKALARSLIGWYELGRPFTPAQLQAIREWARA
jgi:hypothetical protein